MQPIEYTWLIRKGREVNFSVIFGPLKLEAKKGYNSYMDRPWM